MHYPFFNHHISNLFYSATFIATTIATTIVTTTTAIINTCQLYILSIVHLVNCASCQLYILSIVHLVNCTSCQLYILSIVYPINCTFCQLCILLIIHPVYSAPSPIVTIITAAIKPATTTVATRVGIELTWPS